MASLPWAFCIITLLTMNACISLTPEAQQVRVTTNPQAVTNCTFLQNVKSATGWGGAMQGVGASNVTKAMQNKTAELGGNVLYITSTSGGYAIGEAYKCP